MKAFVIFLISVLFSTGVFLYIATLLWKQQDVHEGVWAILFVADFGLVVWSYVEHLYARIEGFFTERFHLLLFTRLTFYVVMAISVILDFSQGDVTPEFSMFCCVMFGLIEVTLNISFVIWLYVTILHHKRRLRPETPPGFTPTECRISLNPIMPEATDERSTCKVRMVDGLSEFTVDGL